MKGLRKGDSRPFRKIEYVVTFGFDAGMMTRNKYHLECGHETWASNSTNYRVRCPYCPRIVRAVKGDWE